jgi:perosamine synthetase
MRTKMIPISKPIFGEEEIDAVKDVLESGSVAQGKKVEEFERLFSDYIGINHAIAVANGTIALDVALKAVRIKQGDEIIVPDFTFISTANSILFQGARPVFADVDDRTFNLNPTDVLEKITDKTKAIIGVHLFGHPFDVKAIQEICEDHNLILIEDCAQAHGAEYEGRRVGSFGVISCFSFYATKNITTGEGGMITTDSKEIAEMCRLLRNHGESQKYYHTMLGYNYRMTEIQAAIGLIQLKKLDGFNDRRIYNAEYLNSHINVQGLKLPYKKNWIKHVYHQYAVTIEEGEGFPMSRKLSLSGAEPHSTASPVRAYKKALPKKNYSYTVREKFMQYLRKKGIGCAIHYPLPIHKQPLYQQMGYTDENVKCPVATALSKKILSLPVYPALSDEELKYIVEIINSYER